MDLFLQLTEAATRKLVEETQIEPGKSYTSIFRIDNQPILPPLMTAEKRVEMQQYREQALKIEQKKKQQQLRKQPQQTTTTTVNISGSSTNPPIHRQFSIDVSTNTEKNTFRRCVQRLQRSETLIYDNKFNAIIKFSPSIQQKPVRYTRIMYEDQVMWMQGSSSQTNHQFGMLQTKEVATHINTIQSVPVVTEPEDEPIDRPSNTLQRSLTIVQLSSSSDEESEAASELDIYHPVKEKESVVYLMTAQSKSPEQLQRSKTVPVPIPTVVLRSSIHFPSVRSSSTDRSGKNFVKASSVPVPIPFRSPNNKIEVKQRLAPTDTITGSSFKSKSKAATTSSSSNSSNIKGSCTIPSVLTPHRGNHSSHASCHSKANYHHHHHNHHQEQEQQQQAMSIVKRRLSYDPRASLRRSAQHRKANNGGSGCGGGGSSTNSNSSRKSTALQPIEQQSASVSEVPSETSSGSTTGQWKLQHRMRFKRMVEQQQQEQRRLESHFEAQQKMLVDQLLYDLQTSTVETEVDVISAATTKSPFERHSISGGTTYSSPRGDASDTNANVVASSSSDDVTATLHAIN